MTVNQGVPVGGETMILKNEKLREVGSDLISFAFVTAFVLWLAFL
jgi:hypothetical protein|tara:strand:- start:1166 stop:1300 length:135 start_codon:yes stop_codon:yes gene_type:complete